MVPHLVRAWMEHLQRQGYAHFITHTHMHTHTDTHAVQIHALLVMGWYNERKENDRSVYAEEKRRVFNFDLRKKE